MESACPVPCRTPPAQRLVSSLFWAPQALRDGTPGPQLAQPLESRGAACMRGWGHSLFSLLNSFHVAFYNPVNPPMWVLLSPNQMITPVGACDWFWLQDDHGFSTPAFPVGMLDTKGTTGFSPLCQVAVSLAGVMDGRPPPP